MNRPFQCWLPLALLVGSLALGSAAQEPAGTKKGDGKAEPGKVGEPAKAKDIKALPDQGKNGPVVAVPSEAKGILSLPPLSVVIPLEQYQKLKEAADKRAAKVEKTLAHSCELTGRLDGDYVTLRGEFAFATQEPRTTVVLGLQGAHLTEKGELDGQPPLVGGYTEEEGFTVRVDEPGNHRLVLHLRAEVKRAAVGTRGERVLVLGLPGTVITTLSLDLPPTVKEVRCNDVTEKHRVQGKWFFALGKKQTLTLAWREPLAQAGAGPRLTVDGKVKVSLLGAEVEIGAELLLEDPRGQTRECQLTFPPQADVKVDPPAGIAFELIGPTGKNPYHVLRFLEPNAEPWKVTAFVRVSRPASGSRLPIGPFFVHGAQQQRGSITVFAAPDPGRKQRLIYHRHGEVFQHDPPKTDATIEAVFQYWGLPNPAKPMSPGGPRVPLELEVRSEGGPLHASVDQSLRLRPGGAGWELDLTARVLVQGSYGSGDFIEVELPRPRPVGTSTLAVAPWAAFPGALPWPGLGLVRGGSHQTWAVPQEFLFTNRDGNTVDVPVPDARGRCRVPLGRGAGKGYTLTLTGKYAVSAERGRVRVGLPRLLGIQEQGSKITVQTDDALELLDGERGQELPVPDKHRYQFDVDQTPAFVDVAWRPSRAEFPAEALIDVSIHGWTARVHQRLTFGSPLRPTAAQPSRLGQVELQVPAGVHGLTQWRGKDRTELIAENGRASVTPEGEAREIVLEYDLRLQDAAGGPAQDSPHILDLAAIWPSRATRLAAKVRIWCEPGSRMRLADAAAGAVWMDRGIEPVKGHELLPALVLEGTGPQLPLTLHLDQAPGSGIAALVCERGLIEVDVGDDDGLSCRARYLVSKVNADVVEIEFPVDVPLCQPEIHVGEHAVTWKPVDGNRRAARIPLAALPPGRPLVLQIAYRLPRSTQEGWMFGVATLAPPTFRDPVRVHRLRWHVNLPSADLLGVPITPGARPDYRWGMHRLLLAPEPAAADLDAWLLGGAPAADARPTGLSFWPAGLDAQRVYYQPRLAWIVATSTAIVVVFLILYFLRLSRTGLAVALGLLALAVLALALTLPALLPVFFYGAQPGLAVVVLVVLTQWLRQERYRRQLVFIPGFTRLKAGSSLVRNGKSSKRPRETSTIDAPVPSGVANLGPPSSVKK